MKVLREKHVHFHAHAKKIKHFHKQKKAHYVLGLLVKVGSFTWLIKDKRVSILYGLDSVVLVGN